ncbi:CBL-interacting serine/threonine-protein kinase 26 [Raphanus sativus]|nr:CBL-interacting serine/threonine-protein kinase 26 [Raphanus sativus]
MNRPKVQRRIVGKYEVGKTIGQGTFAKVRYAKNTETGESVALKILDKQKLLKNNKMAGQIKREISTMKLINHPNVVRVYEVLASKTKIYIVLEFAMGGNLFDKIPENLLLDAQGNLKVSDFGLSALSRQAGGDGLLHTACGTPNYAAPEVVTDQGYDGATADLWSCGVILFELLSGYLPFEDSNLMTLYNKITAAEYNCPSWLSPGAKNLIVRILDPNPTTRIKVPEILEDAWFKKDYKPTLFEEKDKANLADVEAVFRDSEEHHVTEKKEEKPTPMNAFDLISMSRALDLGNFFEEEGGFKRETRFAATGSANELVQKIEAASKPLGFEIQKKNFKMRLENVNPGRKGNLEVATEIFQVSPSLHMVEVRKTKGDTLEFHKFYKKLSTTLNDVVWKSGDTSDSNNK